jgi:predicted ATPase/DNA-binding winged helix-turn-helix (wHTH) protein
MDRSSEMPLAFGRFLLLPHRRELFADNEPVRLGGRAFDVLMALVDARGSVLSKDALMERAWPGRIVEESALQSQISALRSALGADRDLIRTISGRGYQFTGEIHVVPVDADAHADAGNTTSQSAAPHAPLPGAYASTNLPAPISELIGRDDVVAEIQNLVLTRRLVTLTGSGGIGKTRLAVAASRAVLSHFAHGVWFADFSPLGDAAIVPAKVVTAIGLKLGSGQVSAQRVAQALADRQLLVVMDTCEHLIAAVAELAEAVLGASEAVHLLVTSREPLQVEGEWIYPVPPLGVPDEGIESEDELLRSGAGQLFLQRARAANPRLVLDRRALAGVAAVCRRVDGIPLAIEMAAARTSMLRPDEIAARLDDRFQLLIGRRRTALPRHQTLRATLDWSYDLLTESERMVLRRLAIFAGAFSLNAAGLVAAQLPEIAPWQVIECVSVLVSKSLVVAEAGQDSMRFRLLDTTRAYGLEKLAESGDRERLLRRHAEYYMDLMDQAEAEWQTRPTADWLWNYEPEIDNLRSALDWAFSASGDASLGIALTTAALPLWLHLSLLEECRSRVEQALGTKAELGPRREMKLNAALGSTLSYTRSVTDPEVREAWARALELAEYLGDVDYQLRALLGVWGSHIRGGGRRLALELAERFRSLAASHPSDRMVGERMIGEVEYLAGNLVAARSHIERMLTGYSVSNRWSDLIRFQVDQPSRARAFLARTLWLQGFPDQAMLNARRGVEDAQSSNHPLSLCYALALAACPIAVLRGDVDEAEHYIEMLLGFSRRHALPLWEGWGCFYKGVLLIKRGDFANGARLLHRGLSALDAARFAVRFIAFLGDAALALGSAGEIAEGLAEVDAAVAQFGATEEKWLIADLLRSKGELLLLQGGPAAAASAETLFLEALESARQTGALSWELRAATSLIRLKRLQSRPTEVLPMLQSVYDRLTEGFGTPDVIAARQLLDELNSIRCS